MWTQNICFVFALKVAFSNLSGIVWTRPKAITFVIKFLEFHTDPYVWIQGLVWSFEILITNVLTLTCSRGGGVLRGKKDRDDRQKS